MDIEKIESYKIKIKSTNMGSFLWVPCRRIYYFFLLIRDIIGMFLRKQNIGVKKYKKLIQLKNVYQGERCFIIATGPSLTFDDIEKLKNEKTFAVNSIASVYNKISYKPTFYVIQDGWVFYKLKSKIYESGFSNVFYGNAWIKKKDVREDWIEFPLVLGLTSRSPFRKDYDYCKMMFSENANIAVFGGGATVVYSVLQLAVFLGFREIYLLGCDCSYNKEIENFADYGHYGLHDVPPNVGERMIESHKEAKKYADAHGIKIYNATRGGMLEVFQRVDLDDVLSQ